MYQENVRPSPGLKHEGDLKGPFCVERAPLSYYKIRFDISNHKVLRDVFLMLYCGKFQQYGTITIEEY